MTSSSTLILLRTNFASSVELSKDETTAPLLTWDFWALRAWQDYSIPSNFFHLVRQPWASEAGLIERNISPIYRYLELAAEIEVLPEMAVSVSQGVIFGVYEARSAVERCLETDNLPMLKFFLRRLKPQAFDELKMDVEDPESYFQMGYQGASRFRKQQTHFNSQETVNFLLNYLSDPNPQQLKPNPIPQQDEQPFRLEEPLPNLSGNLDLSIEIWQDAAQEALTGNFQRLHGAFSLQALTDDKKNWKIFKVMVRTGKVEVLNQVLPYFSSIQFLDGLTAEPIENQVPDFPFDHTRKPSDYGSYSADGQFQPGRYYFPVREKVEKAPERNFFKLAIESGNPHIFDFFAYLRGWNLADLAKDMEEDEDEAEDFVYKWQTAYGTYPERFVGFYAIFQRFLPQVKFLDYPNFEKEWERVPRESVSRSVDVANLILSRVDPDDHEAENLALFSLGFAGGKINLVIFLTLFLRDRFHLSRRSVEETANKYLSFPLSQRILRAYLNENLQTPRPSQ